LGFSFGRGFLLPHQASIDFFLGTSMKAFFFVLLAAIFVGGGIYLLDQMGDDPIDTTNTEKLDPKLKNEQSSEKVNAKEGIAPQMVASKKAPTSKKFRFSEGEVYGVDVKRLWAKLRPPEEALVPDPDHVGPCPPASDGGHPALVIRRYKEQNTGYFVWIHEDGSKTVVSPDPVDLGASQASPGARGYTITTMVPTQATRLSPDDDRKN
jgi:hypothetical protein